MTHLREAVGLLNSLPLAGLMLVITAGFLLGRASWRGFSLGPAGGTLAAALALGSMGLSVRALYGSDDPRLTLGTLGFALFIYSVGFEAGPRFFACLFGGSGWRFVVVGVLVNGLAVALAVACGRLFSLGDSVSAGVLSGALTSAPTYAAADEVCSDSTMLALSFALTYPLGLVGIVLMIQIVPKFMRDDLAARTGHKVDVGLEVGDQPSAETTRSFRVERPEVVGKNLLELDLPHHTGCYVLRIHRGDAVFLPTATTRLEGGDRVQARGRLEELQALSEILGAEVDDIDLRQRTMPFRRIHVLSSEAVGKTLKELYLTRRHHCLVTAVHRGQVALEPSAELRLERGDLLEVAGEADNIRTLATELGRFETPAHETDIAVYAGGIVIGLLLSTIPIGPNFQLGMAGGLLIAGVLLGRFRRIGPFNANVPLAARQLVRDLGILLFVAETGVRAGESSFQSMSGMVGKILAAGAITSVLPIVISIWIARRVLGLGAVDAWGSVCGAMTSSSAMIALRRVAENDEPATSYAATYVVASVLVALAGQLVVHLVS